MAIDEDRQHNLRLPISRIPNEILSKVFCRLRDGYVETAEQKRRHGAKCLKGWISITYVCHAWRELALNTSLLWCHIDVLPLFRSWVPELLRRSKHSPLSVIVGRTAREPDLLEVEQHYGRVRKLVLDNPSDTVHQIFSSQSNLQNLESLEISLPSPFVLDDSHLRAEQLRCLALHSCSIDWSSKLLQGLTHLSLVDIPRNYILGCHDFILILSNFPILETLHLTRFLRNEGQVQTHQATQVYLQHLQQLSVNCEVPEMAQFLPCVVVPRSCKLHFSTGNDAIDDKFRVILSWVTNHLPLPTTSSPTSDASDHGQYIRSFHLMFDPDQDLKVKGFCDVLSHEQLETTNPVLEFAVRNSDDESSFDMEIFLSLLPLGCAIFLDVFVASGVCMYPRFWAGNFGSIHTVTTIYLDAETSNFWKALSPANTDNRTVKSLPFLALSSVTVQDPFLDFQLIVDALRVRSHLGGTRLQDLHFSSLAVVRPGSLMIQLRELVSNIQAVALHDTISDSDSISDSDGSSISEDED